ncbi:MAG: four helix bundle protein [Bacteroidetes bacterium]|nr:four helix bundle protein [Bacteroidota bacterium]
MTSLHELQVFNLSMTLGEKVWSIVEKWNYFEKDTIGKQLVKSTDSISANISEGFGRYHFLENKNFCFYARGSLFETKTWITKAHQRKLINDMDFEVLQIEMNELGKKLNNYIKAIGKPTNQGS